MKFVGGKAKECCQKLLDKKFDKYRDAGVPIEIPSDFYDEVRADLSQRIDQLNKQTQNADAKGNLALAEKHKNRLRVLEAVSYTHLAVGAFFIWEWMHHPKK